jgi:putative acyl-CoA dehydrogenase
MTQVESDLTGQIKHSSLNGGREMEGQARRLTEKLALALQALLVVRYSSTGMADAFIASRLCGDHGNAFGTLPPGVDLTSIVEPVQTELE